MRGDCLAYAVAPRDPREPATVHSEPCLVRDAANLLVLDSQEEAVASSKPRWRSVPLDTREPLE